LLNSTTVFFRNSITTIKIIRVPNQSAYRNYQSRIDDIIGDIRNVSSGDFNRIVKIFNAFFFMYGENYELQTRYETPDVVKEIENKNRKKPDAGHAWRNKYPLG